MKTKRNRKQSKVRKVMNYVIAFVVIQMAISLLGIAILRANVAGSTAHPSAADSIMTEVGK